MQGTVIGFDPASGRGAIAGHDGNRYEFVRNEWRANTAPVAGMAVDFSTSGAQATGVFAVSAQQQQGAFDWRNFLLSWEGRITRFDYWVRFTVPYVVISTILSFVDGFTGNLNLDTGMGLLSGVFTIVAIWPSFMVGIKRCHDRDRSGWFLLLILLPVIGWIWLLIDLGFLRGTVGPNRFGPDPLAA